MAVINPLPYLMQQGQQNPFYNPFSPKPNIAAGVGSSLTGYFQQAQAKKETERAQALQKEQWTREQERKEMETKARADYYAAQIKNLEMPTPEKITAAQEKYQMLLQSGMSEEDALQQAVLGRPPKGSAEDIYKETDRLAKEKTTRARAQNTAINKVITKLQKEQARLQRIVTPTSAIDRMVIKGSKDPVILEAQKALPNIAQALTVLEPIQSNTALGNPASKFRETMIKMAGNTEGIKSGAFFRAYTKGAEKELGLEKPTPIKPQKEEDLYKQLPDELKAELELAKKQGIPEEQILAWYLKWIQEQGKTIKK